MPTTDLAADPHARVHVGQKINDNVEHPGFNDGTIGIWTRDRYIWCGATGPTTQYVCSRPAGHPAGWNHVAAAENDRDFVAIVREIWGAVAAPAVVGVPDPYAAVEVGDRETTPIEQDDALMYTHDTGRWCAQPNPDGWGICSRKHGHEQTWKHVAASLTRVLGVWGGTPLVVHDPFENLQRGSWLSDYAGTENKTNGVRMRRPEDRCGHTEPNLRDGRNFPCTRPTQHPGLKHIGTDTNQVYWVSPNTAVTVATPFAENPDPEDGSPIDPDELVCVEPPVVGVVVRLRDRVNRLYVMGHRHSAGQIEVLDMTLNELRAVPIARCVNVPDDQAWTTVDELTMVAKWYAQHRDETRKVAIREYKNGRWCMAGLNEQLANLGMESYEPTLTGEVVFRVPFEHENTSTKASEIQALVEKALADEAVKKALIKALPEVKDIEFDPARLTVRGENFARS